MIFREIDEDDEYNMDIASTLTQIYLAAIERNISDGSIGATMMDAIKKIRTKFKKGGTMMKVLWISRHKLDTKAEDALFEIFGEVDIITYPKVFASDGEQARREFDDITKNFDLIGGVFPAQLWLSFIIKSPSVSIFTVVSIPKQAKEGSEIIFEFDHIEYKEYNINY